VTKSRSQRTASRPSEKRVRRKSASLAPKKMAVAYAFAGDITDLPTLEENILSERIRTVLIPKTTHAENALKDSKRFRPILLNKYGLEKLRIRRPVIAPHGIVKKVEQAQINEEAYKPDARARAILRGRSFAAADLGAAGGAYTVDEVRALLNNVSRQALDKRVKEGALLAVPGPGGTRRFPTAQFDGYGGLVKGLKDVQKALGFSSPWAVLNFLVNENDYLNRRRPIDALRQGEIEPVITAATSIGVQGA